MINYDPKDVKITFHGIKLEPHEVLFEEVLSFPEDTSSTEELVSVSFEDYVDDFQKWTAQILKENGK